ncbi:MAG: hypothetical protein HUK22_03910 [Thermoguttaceae bacterium]|nr:hypothetical protein [Thermoguttaceae bacterium]
MAKINFYCENCNRLRQAPRELAGAGFACECGYVGIVPFPDDGESASESFFDFDDPEAGAVPPPVAPPIIFHEAPAPAPELEAEPASQATVLAPPAPQVAALVVESPESILDWTPKTEVSGARAQRAASRKSRATAIWILAIIAFALASGVAAFFYVRG